jgi:hypothetical protein
MQAAWAVAKFGSNPMKMAEWNAPGSAGAYPGSNPGCERDVSFAGSKLRYESVLLKTTAIGLGDGSV